MWGSGTSVRLFRVGASVPFHPIPDPPSVIVWFSSAGNGFARARKFIEFAGFDCLADEAISD